MNINELKAEANRLGFSISKKITYEKISKCQCGSKRIASEIGMRSKYYRCTHCGYTSEPAKTKYEAIHNWNKATNDIEGYKKYMLCKIENLLKGDK